MLVDYNLYKKMVRKLIFCLIVVVLALELVSAASTEIKIRTLANHKVYIYILEPDQVYKLLDSYNQNSDGNGEVSYTYNSLGTNKIDVLVNVKKDNVKVFSQRFEDYEAGKPIYIRMDYQEITGDYKEGSQAVDSEDSIENKTEGEKEEEKPVEIDNVEEERIKKEVGITGEVVSEDKGASSYIYYIIGGVVLVVIIIFLVVWKFNSEGGVFPVSDSFNEGGSGSSKSRTGDLISKDREIRKLEGKVREMEKEINIVKNREKIRAVERKLEEDRRELERLRRGE